jgi:tRNA(Ile2) C34 agmatinyltransferase TiaS
VTGALLDRPRPLFAGADAAPAGGGRVTLEERLEATLRSLVADSAAECPVCHARMTRAGEGDGGECGSCGSRLA